MMQWLAQAPANIALIKYMGKTQEGTNQPANSSLSYTLNHLLSTVQLEEHSAKHDMWEPLATPGGELLALSPEGQKRFLDHLARLKAYFGYERGFLVESANNFPSSCGLASSASSFAALTKCAVLALSELTQKPVPSVEEEAKLSQQGSGSSCRSFFAPWALWEKDEVKAIDLPYPELMHQVVLISHETKEVSSSEAHRRVLTSSLFATRPARAQEHLKTLVAALKAKDWASAFQVCWREFQDMHQLFATCSEPFTYMNENTRLVLNQLQDFWTKKGDGPLITMDAGPNIHLLYRPDQTELALQIKSDYLIGNYDVL
jgi:diphosphomevalonate decarboxylase